MRSESYQGNYLRREISKLQIGEKEYSEILVTDADGGLIASITDQDIIEEKNCKVTCVPTGDMPLKQIKKEMKEEKELEQRKLFQEAFPVSDEEMEFFEHLYKKERKYRTVILILSLICLELLLSIQM